MTGFSVSFIEEALQVKVIAPDAESLSDIQGVSIDSRTLLAGNIFFCIRGNQTDGHLFIPQALSAGAAAIVIDHEYALDKGDTFAAVCTDIPLYVVEDTTAALQALARRHRERLTATFIGVTGSSGKTSTKEMLSSMLSHLYGADNVFATEGNLNNHYGVPLTLLSIDEHCKWAVIEMGMSHAGEIEFLSRLVNPSHAIITSISLAHSEFFSYIEQIAKAKLEILSGMTGGNLCYPNGAPLQQMALELAGHHQVKFVGFGEKDEEVISLQAGKSGIRFNWMGITVENHNYFTGEMASDLIGALKLLHAIGIERTQLAEAAPYAVPVTSSRFQLFRLAVGEREHLLVDDTYNANPDSFGSAIVALRNLLREGTLALFAGEMAELGNFSEKAHRDIGNLIASAGFQFVGLSGKGPIRFIEETLRSRNFTGEICHADTPDDLILKLKDRFFHATTFDGILVKGSRSTHMEKLVEYIKESGYV